MARLRRGDLLVVALAVVALAALAAFRPEPGASTDTYATTDFRSGGTAAWYELLQREGVPGDRFERRPGELDGSIGTLIDAFGVDPVTGDVRTPADEAALDAWVRAGDSCTRG